MLRRVNVSREIFDMILSQSLKGTSTINTLISTLLSKVSVVSREKLQVRLVRRGRSE